MASETFTNAYLLTENRHTGAFTTTEQIQGSATISDTQGSELYFGTPIEYTDSYGTLPLIYDGTVTENGKEIGFAAVDPTTGNVYLFTDTSVPAHTTLIVDTGVPYSICFAAGTAIATPAGNRAVETLAIGDVVTTSDGQAKAIKWMGRQTVTKKSGSFMRTNPIRIRAGALGDNLPVRDLLVSPDHALLVDGVLIQAAALINDVSISRETTVADSFIYYHVELDDHALVLAEGVPAETFVDNVQRTTFDNHAEYQALYPDAVAVSEMPLPRAKSARQVPYATRGRLLAQATALFGEVAKAA